MKNSLPWFPKCIAPGVWKNNAQQRTFQLEELVKSTINDLLVMVTSHTITFTHADNL